MLYQNLIKKLPTRDNKKIDSLDGEWDMRDDNGVKQDIGAANTEMHQQSKKALVYQGLSAIF